MTTVPNPDELLATDAAARMLGLSSSTMVKARLSGAGPCFVKLGHAVRYRRADILEWIERNIRRSTSQAA